MRGAAAQAAQRRTTSSRLVGHDRPRRLRRLLSRTTLLVRGALAERPPVAAPAVKRRGACRAGAPGRRRRDRRLDHQARQGVGRRPDRRTACISRSAQRTTPARSITRGDELASGAARRGASRSRRFKRQPDEGEPTYAQKLEAGGPSEVDLDPTPQMQLSAAIRALSPHIGARAELDGRPRHDLASASSKTATDRSARGAAPTVGRRMTYEEFRRGLR